MFIILLLYFIIINGLKNTSNTFIISRTSTGAVLCNMVFLLFKIYLSISLAMVKKKKKENCPTVEIAIYSFCTISFIVQYVFVCADQTLFLACHTITPLNLQTAYKQNIPFINFFFFSQNITLIKIIHNQTLLNNSIIPLHAFLHFHTIHFFLAFSLLIYYEYSNFQIHIRHINIPYNSICVSRLGGSNLISL